MNQYSLRVGDKVMFRFNDVDEYLADTSPFYPLSMRQDLMKYKDNVFEVKELRHRDGWSHKQVILNTYVGRTNYQFSEYMFMKLEVWTISPDIMGWIKGKRWQT